MAEPSTTGGCLCGGVRFELARAVGPFELCHCSRCRKASGSAFAALVGVRTEDFWLLAGAELIRRYEAPIRERPPPYCTAFCARCGSRAPVPPPGADWFEIAAGTLEGDPGLRPDRHIYVEGKAPWYEIADALPQLDAPSLAELRQRTRGTR